jgi:hypothetical protein
VSATLVGFGIWDLGFGVRELALGVYVAGALWGLLVTDARPVERISLALLWPVGPLAFVVTVTLLLAALPVAFPKIGIPLWLAAGSLWWLIR